MKKALTDDKDICNRIMHGDKLGVAWFKFAKVSAEFLFRISRFSNLINCHVLMMKMSLEENVCQKCRQKDLNETKFHSYT
jgi:hypothetical protein